MKPSSFRDASQFVVWNRRPKKSAESCGQFVSAHWFGFGTTDVGFQFHQERRRRNDFCERRTERFVMIQLLLPKGLVERAHSGAFAIRQRPPEGLGGELQKPIQLRRN